MNIIYIANSRIPTEKAHGIEVMKLCEAFGALGRTTLVLPRRFNKISADPFSYYQTEKTFTITRLPVIDAIPLHFLRSIGFWIESAAFACSVFLYVLFKTDADDLVISHDNAPLLAASLIRKNIYYDIHDFPVRGLVFYRMLLRRCKGVVTTNAWKGRALEEKFSIATEKILVCPNGVDAKYFDIAMTRAEARQKLGLDRSAAIAAYTGHLFSWKGTDTLIEAARVLERGGWRGKIYLVGGTETDIKAARRIAGNISTIEFAGHRQHGEIPLWLKSADVLVLPNTAREDISKYFTSPMKLFEYMMSKTPIVASDLPSVRYIASDKHVSFFEPDNPESLASALLDVFERRDGAISKALRAYAEVMKYTWRGRAKAILEFHESRSK